MPFFGKEMISYPISYALKAGVFTSVYVSTDDESIAAVGLKYGAKILPRKASLADDHSSTDAVMKDVLQNCEADGLCCLYATAVLVDEKILKKAYEKFKSSKAGFLISAGEFSFPVQRAFYLNKDERVQMFDPTQYYKRSQDLVKGYQDAGAFYFGTRQAWLKELLFSPKTCIYKLEKHLVCDIDTQQDLEFAKILFAYKQSLKA